MKLLKVIESSTGQAFAWLISAINIKLNDFIVSVDFKCKQ
jgi:hypothetical protein